MNISVYITSFNQRDYLAEAIDSVLNQSLRPFEIIVVDDASSDGSQEMIRSYAQRYPDLIRGFYHRRNRGIAPNKAFAQKQVKGEWFTYIDGDDRFLPQKLDNEYRALDRNQDADVVFSNFYFIDEHGVRTGIWATEETHIPNGDIFNHVFARSFPGQVVFRNELVSRRCLDAVGTYDLSRRTHEDWDWKIRISKQFRMIYCPKTGIEYRRHGDSISSQMSAAQLLREIIGVYESNRSLLADLPDVQRGELVRELGECLRRRAKRVVRGDAIRGRRIKALMHGIEFRSWLRPMFVIKMCLPGAVFHRAKKLIPPNRRRHIS